MSVDLVRRVGGGEGEGVESVVNTSGIKSGFGFRCGRRGLVVERRKIETFGLLDSGFGILRCGPGVFFLIGEKGVFLCLLACCFLFLCLGFLSVCVVRDISSTEVRSGRYFLALDFAPLLHS